MQTKTNIPTLRFPEFEGDWVEKKLGTLGSFIGGGTPDSSNAKYWTGDIPWISSSDLNEDSIHLVNITRFISDAAIKESATKIVPKGSILMVSRVGIGKFAVAKQDLCTSQDFTNLITKEDPYFLAFYFKARSNRFISLSQGTSIKGFTGKDIRDLKFLLPPPLPEQQKIAAFLSAVDARIQALQRKKELLQAYKKGLMQQLFAQTLRFKDEQGRDFPDWEEKQLGEVLKIGNGRDYKHLEKGNIPVYGTGGYMTSVNDFLYDGESVGIGRKGTIDKPFFLKGKFWTVDTLFYTHSFKKVDPFFIFLLFQKINWKKYNEASGVPSLSKGTLEKIEVSIPSLPEQQKIAAFLGSMDAAIERVQAQVAQTQRWKQGLLQQLFV